MGLPQIPWEQALDTLAIATQTAFLAHRRRWMRCAVVSAIDNASRTLHGALLDSEILAEVYLELIGGRQPDFWSVDQPERKEGDTTPDWAPKPRPTPLPSRITPQETAAHTEFVDKLGDKRCVEDALGVLLFVYSRSDGARISLRYSATKSMFSRFSGGKPPSRVTSLTTRRRNGKIIRGHSISKETGAI